MGGYVDVLGGLLVVNRVEVLDASNALSMVLQVDQTILVVP